jgi:hypothetical protein
LAACAYRLRWLRGRVHERDAYRFPVKMVRYDTVQQSDERSDDVRVWLIQSNDAEAVTSANLDMRTFVPHLVNEARQRSRADVQGFVVILIGLQQFLQADPAARHPKLQFEDFVERQVPVLQGEHVRLCIR